MIQVTDKTKCAGCTACASICPTQCISMQSDEEGFLYPHVDNDRCIACGACEKTCPVIHKKTAQDEDIRFYVARAKNKDVLAHSTSGGFVTPLANYVFEHNGVVCGAVFDEKWNVVHRIFDREEKEDGLERMRGSKYVQSDIRGIFPQLKDFLEDKRVVCFIGTPCQVYGLYNYLGMCYDNIFTISLVCHGVPSPKLWRRYIDYQEQHYSAKISRVSFRNKTYGYHSSTMKLEFVNGKKYCGSARVDYMLKSFFSEISSRPSCYHCAFKGVSSVGDFTIYDCWRPSLLIDGFDDDDRGYTNVIGHSTKAQKLLLELASQYKIYPIDKMRAIRFLDKIVTHSVLVHPDRDRYYADLEGNKLEQVINRYIPVTWKDRIVEGTKPLVFRLGLYTFLKKLIK